MIYKFLNKTLIKKINPIISMNHQDKKLKMFIKITIIMLKKININKFYHKISEDKI